MNSKTAFLIAGCVLAGAVGGYIVAQFGGNSISPNTGEKRVLYWQAPMDPNFRSDKPGKSPMGMDLIPIYEGGEAQGGEPALRIDPVVVNNIGVRTQPVMRGAMPREINTVGTLMSNDNLVRRVDVRSEGWIERMLVKATGEYVEKDELLFQIYSPTLVNAQNEYLQALRLKQSGLTNAARERLMVMGMMPAQIDALARAGNPVRLVDIFAPQDGYVMAMGVEEGAFVKPGTMIFSLADLTSIWVMVDVFEKQASWVADGQAAVMTLDYLPGRLWSGVVDYVYPMIDPKSRTLRVRLKFDNPDGLLKPNMFASVTIQAAPRADTLHIPREALIRTAQEERVMLALGAGRFRPARVEAGVEVGDRVEILSGVREGEEIVTSAQFLLDSEASLQGGLTRLSVDEGNKSSITATGSVDAISMDERKVTLSHRPIEELGWPAMTMDFRVAPDVDLSDIDDESHVAFTFTRESDGDVVVTDIKKMPH